MRFLGSTLLLLSGLILAVVVDLQAGGVGDNAKKLVGVWEVVKAEGAPPGATVEFKKNGKMQLAFDVKGKAITIDGTYKVEGNKIHVVLSFMGKKHEETSTIQTLNEKTLIIRDEKGKVEEYKRRK
jgi:uncharacterized protein (TIGR03066 family)